MKQVLVACEFSGIVREAFVRQGFDAWSCDLFPSELPGNHLQMDVLDVLDWGWDLMISHPPCTFLCRNRASRNKIEDRVEDIQKATAFFLKFINAPIEKICVENPVPSSQSGLPPYTQIIQPWQFGHDYSKKTCLWLRGLPDLKPTRIVSVTYITTPGGHRYTSGWYKMPRKTKDRSRTFQGIADAMADQWGRIL